MLDNNDAFTTSLAKTNDEEPLPSTAMNELSVEGGTVSARPAKLQVQLHEIEEVSGVNSRIVFNVPQSDGSHAVWIEYHFGGTKRWVVNETYYQGQQWNYLDVSNLPVGRGKYVTWWRYKSDGWSEVGEKPLNVIAAPVIDGSDDVQVIIDTVTGSAGGGGEVTVVRSGFGTVMSETKTVGGDKRWSLKLLGSVGDRKSVV